LHYNVWLENRILKIFARLIFSRAQKIFCGCAFEKSTRDFSRVLKKIFYAGPLGYSDASQRSCRATRAFADGIEF